MKTMLPASILLACCVSVSSAAHAQSILNQSNDDLLKGFDAGKSLTAPALSGPASVGPAQPSWAPQRSVPGSDTSSAAPGIQSPGSIAPGAYQPPPQLLGQPQVQKSLLQRVIEGAMNAVNVSSNDADGTHVKVPFVNVDVGGSTSGVKVKAPFVNYDSVNGASVKAPFVNVGNDRGVKVKAPFVNINRGAQNNASDQGSSLK